MDDAIWAVIGDGVKFIAGTMVAVSFIMSLFAILAGLRADRFSVFRRLEGVIRGSQQDQGK